MPLYNGTQRGKTNGSFRTLKLHFLNILNKRKKVASTNTLNVLPGHKEVETLLPKLIRRHYRTRIN